MAWRALEDAKKEGKLRSIGVSSFFPNLLVNFCGVVDTIPAVNQIETHPWYVRNQDLGEARRYSVTVGGRGPLGGTGYHADESEVLKSIAKEYHKSPSQVVLCRNIDIWDFTLTKDEMEAVNTLDTGGIATCTRRNDPEMVRAIFQMGKNR